MAFISVRMDANVAPLEGLEAYVKAFPKKAQELGRETYEEIRPMLLSELRFYPPVPAGSRYQRTYRLRKNWQVGFEATGEGFRITIQNGTRYAVWVVGSLAQDVFAAQRFQREFHARHGWVPVAKTAAFWFDAFVESFIDAFKADIGEFASATFKRRAFTRIR